MNTIIRDYKYTWTFYILATIIPWSFWGLAAYISHSPDYSSSAEIASILSFTGLLAPVLLVLVLIHGDRRIIDDMLQRMISLRSGKPIYWIMTVALMPASILLAQLVSLLFGYPASQFAFSENFSFSSGLFPVWFLLIAAPVIEELAWHSYGTDSLRYRFSLFTASMIFALFWGIWHMPLSFINDYYHSNLVETGWIHGVNFLVSLFPFVLIMNWLYYKTGRSILSAVIFHVSAGYFNEIFATAPDSKVIQTVLLTMLSIYIIINDREFFFSRKYALKS